MKDSWEPGGGFSPGRGSLADGRTVQVHIRKISNRGNDTIPPVLGILVLGILCIISGLYLAFFSRGISHTASIPQLSPNDLLGNLLILAGVIILLIGSYRQKSSPVY